MFAHGLVSLIADDFIFPFVQYRATYANFPGDFTGGYGIISGGDGFILMVLDGRVVSLSLINSQEVVPSGADDEKRTFKVTNAMTLKKLIHR